MRSFPQRSEYVVENNPPWDRLTSVEDHRKEAMANWTDGAYPGGWIVTPDSGMAVLVSPGAGRIQGVFCYDEPTEGEYLPRTLVVQPSDNTYDRIDLVVVRLDNTQEARNCDWYVKQGTPAAAPASPALTRSSDVYELCIARIYIPKNSASITADRITDTRLSSALCGLSTTKVWDLALEDIKALLDAAIDQTAVGLLQNQIDAVAAKTNTTAGMTSTAAASAQDKGSMVIDRELVDTEVIEVNFPFGNTHQSPTITIEGITYNIIGLPFIGMLHSESYWINIRMEKNGTDLVVDRSPGLILETGVTGRWEYTRMMDGKVYCSGEHTKGSNNTFTANGIGFVSEEMAVSIPAKMFNSAPKCRGLVTGTVSAVVWPIRRELTPTSFTYALAKFTDSAAYYRTEITLEGSWLY